jgi:hypothetical protein
MYGPCRDWEQREIWEALQKQGRIGDTPEEQLANAMFELNCNAVDQRYGDNQAQEFRPLDFKFKHEYLGSGYAAYDRLGEWIYQCSEGDVPESSELYKVMHRLYDSMAHSFFRDLRERKDERDLEVRRELSERITKLEAKRRKV